MKSEHIKRGVQRGLRSRKAGSAPSIGRVSRMYGAFGRKKGKRSGSSGDPRRERRDRIRRIIIRFWSIGLGVMAVGVLTVFFLLWLRPAMFNRERDTSERDRQVADARARVVAKFPVPNNQAAVEIAKRAMGVNRLVEVEERIRCGDSSAQEVVDFLQELRLREGEPKEILSVGEIFRNSLQLVVVVASYGDASAPKERLAMLTPDAKGVWKMDFGAFSRVMKPTWDEIVGGATGIDDDPPCGRIRVFFAKERLEYYNGPFHDEEQWVAYGMICLDHLEQTLVGYCRRGSNQHRAMDSMLMLASAGDLLRATLEVRRPRGAERKQLEIRRVLAEDWVMGSKPFDERTADE